MSDYNPPVQDMLFVLRDVIGIETLGADLDDATMGAILDEAAKLARDVIAPLNEGGDRAGAVLENGHVKTAPGFKEAYKAYCENGWNGVPFPQDCGGMGLPWALAFAAQEMWQSANMSFGLCPLLNQAAIEAMHLYGSAEQKKIYLEKLVSGAWTGTMNLTEPQAGSDLGLIRMQADRQADGTYKLKGQKIFITYGDHDMTDNIIHMVLARTPGAPAGIKGISMFLVPKFIPGADGKPGARNDLHCIKLEEKLGIHASPTCVMAYGDAGGATGYLIGRENEGIKYMFTMMNNARLSVGLQGVAIAERAYQHALAYAKIRVQGARLDSKDGGSVPIIEHADVRRMLLSMKAQIEAGRALAYEAALAADLAKSGDADAQAKVDLLTPLVKAWCTDMAVEVVSTGIQIHGGMGFIEETGAAQYYRDARILPIYEGTNNIQAADLAFRKTLMTGAAPARAWMAQAAQTLEELDDCGLGDLREALGGVLHELHIATELLLAVGEKDRESVAAVSVPYLNAFGTFAAGMMMARSALAAKESADEKTAGGKIATARFFMAHILPRCRGLLETVANGGPGVTHFSAAMF